MRMKWLLHRIVLCAAALIATVRAEVRFPLNPVPQKGQDLCWAAAMVNVMNYMVPDLALSQCGMVDTVKGNTDCCNNPPNGSHDWLVQTCNTRRDTLPIRRIRKPGTNDFYTSETNNGKVPWPIAIAELDQNRPFIFSFRYLNSKGQNSGDGHILFAYGYNKNWWNYKTNQPDSALIVYDPFGPRNAPAVGDAYFLSHAAYDFAQDPFTNQWYGDGKSWWNIR